MPNASDALKCFEENIRFYGNADTNPEKYNLYNGLGLLASAIDDLQHEVHRLRQEISSSRSGS